MSWGNLTTIPSYAVYVSGKLNYEYDINKDEKTINNVMFTFRDKVLIVKGKYLWFTKIIVKPTSDGNFDVYLKNTKEIHLRQIKGKNIKNIEKYLIKKNNQLKDHLEYIEYIAEKGLGVYECIAAFPL
jgi:hypothetical protein